MRILSLDLSLTSTGWALGGDSIVEESGVLCPPKNLDGMGRLYWIRSEVRQLSDEADLAVIEGYAFSAHASHAHELGELGGIVRIQLFDDQKPFIDIPPSSLKLFATGKGNANKDLMLAEAIRKLGYTGHSKDEADALWLLRMAHTHYTDSATNEAQRKALAKIHWPRIAAGV